MFTARHELGYSSTPFAVTDVSRLPVGLTGWTTAGNLKERLPKKEDRGGMKPYMRILSGLRGTSPRLGALGVVLWAAWISAAGAGDAISLYRASPSVDSRIPAGEAVEFHLRVQIDTLHPGGLWVYNNGFRIYSPDGAAWDTTYARYLPGWLPFGDRSIRPVNVDGVGADTILFYGEDSAGGFWLVYDDVAWAIGIKVPDSPGVYGKTICLDTVAETGMVWPYSTWVWSTLQETYVPEWDGPHCFTIGCCNGDGMRGNVDYRTGPSGEIDIADLTALVTYLFIGDFLPCYDEGNVDGAESIPGVKVDVHDLTYLVEYLFQGGPPPAPCP